MPERRAKVYQGQGEWGWYVHRTIDGKNVHDTSKVIGEEPERHYDAWFPDHEFAVIAADAWARREQNDDE